MASIAKADYYPGCGRGALASHKSGAFRPYLIGVAGGSASGKTSVCQKIIAQLQQDGALEHRGILSLSQDCFYRNLAPDESAASFNFDHPSAFAFDEICATLESLKAGTPVAIPKYDFLTSARVNESIEVAGADIILFDGILAFYAPELRSLFDLRVFVDVDADTCLVRRIKRDIVERGRDILGVLQQYERTVKPSYERFIFPTKKYADIIIPRGADNAVAIEILFQHIKSQLHLRIDADSSEQDLPAPLRRISTQGSL